MLIISGTHTHTYTDKRHCSIRAELQLELELVANVSCTYRRDIHIYIKLINPPQTELNIENQYTIYYTICGI